MAIFGMEWSDLGTMAVVWGTVATAFACVAAATWNLLPCSWRTGWSRKTTADSESEFLLRPAPPVVRRQA